MTAIKNTTFHSDFKQLGGFAKYIDNSEIKGEPMFFNSSLEFAFDKGGPITRSFIENLPYGDFRSKFAVFDSRVHMLMPGWYPAIPGWHHDDVPRAEIPTGQHFITAGQPDYDNMAYRSKHILGLVNADVCPTEFIRGVCKMSKCQPEELIYRKWHEEIEGMISRNKIDKHSTLDRTLYEFDWQTFHTGTKAVKNGWRWFGRVSTDTDRSKKITNEIRVNAQVYLEFPMEGW